MTIEKAKYLTAESRKVLRRPDWRQTGFRKDVR